jgi:hypothetical protein
LLWLGTNACGEEEQGGEGFPVNMGGMTGGGTGGVTHGVGGQAGAGGVAGLAGGVGDSGGGAGFAGMSAGGMGGMSGGAGGMGGMGGTGGGGMGGTSGGAGGIGGMGGGDSGTGGTGGGMPSGELCMRWNDAHSLTSEGAWNGSTSSCEAGTLSADVLAKAHELHSLYRTMAGLPPVEMTDQGNQLAQECALLMAANGTISHNPSASWDCYTEEGADTAATSSLSTGGALSSVDGYMIDPGNPTTLGHRRWILSNMLASIGFGSADGFSCQYQPAEWGAGGKAWAAWPPPGQVPFESFGNAWAKVDQTGWSIQSDSINLNSADVTVTEGGMDLPVSVTALSPGYGSMYALRFNPMGWSTAAGKTYHVAVSGTSTAIEYDVEVVSCP